MSSKAIRAEDGIASGSGGQAAVILKGKSAFLTLSAILLQR
jgi:hypothetical protein